jgi:hypothetical protein
MKPNPCKQCRVLAKKSFDQIARIVKHEHDGFQIATSELTNVLRGKLVRSLARHQNQRRSGAATAAPKAAGVAQPIEPRRV